MVLQCSSPLSPAINEGAHLPTAFQRTVSATFYHSWCLILFVLEWVSIFSFLLGERVQESWEGGAEQESRFSAGSTPSTEPKVGLHPPTLRPWAEWAEITNRMLNSWRHPGTPAWVSFWKDLFLLMCRSYFDFLWFVGAIVKEVNPFVIPVADRFSHFRWTHPF